MAACHMSEISHQHIPVLLKEAVDQLVTSPSGVYIDATFGRGSHSLAILQKLNQKGSLIAFDKDPEAVAFAKAHFPQDDRFSIFHQSFANLENCLNTLGLMGRVNGILFDLGVSSPQLDNPDRGFSFTRAGKLDMRMDTTQGINAMEWIANVPEKTLADVLFEYGEEKFSRRIAKAIITARLLKPIETTAELAATIEGVMPRRPQDKHPATRSFQAIRIAINQELTELPLALNQSLEALCLGGRLCVISFHSLEDRLVKQFIKRNEQGEDLPRGLPIKGIRSKGRLKAIGKPIKASLQEVNLNPRARSAILRIAEKLS